MHIYLVTILAKYRKNMKYAFTHLRDTPAGHKAVGGRWGGDNIHTQNNDDDKH